MAQDPLTDAIAKTQAELAARQRGETTTVVGEGADAAQVPTETTLPTPSPLARPGETPTGPQAPDLANAGTLIGKALGFRRDIGEVGTQVNIPTAARDPIQVAKEQAQMEIKWDRQQAKRGPADFKGPGPWRFINRLGSTFNAAIADATGQSLETVASALEDLGVKMYNDPSRATEQVHDFLNNLGIATRRYEGLAGRLGSATPEAMVNTAAWIAAAPYLVATRGATALSRLGQDWGRLIQSNPGLIFSQELGSITGARAGAENLGPWGAVLGGVAGGSAASIVHGGVGMAGRALGRVLFTKPPLVPHGAPPIREAYDPETARIIGEQEITSARTLLEGQMAQTLRRAGSQQNPALASRTFTTEAENALSLARNMERHYWNTARAANQGVQVETEPLNQLFAQMRTATAETDLGALPNQFMRRVEGIFRPPQQPAPTILGPTGLPVPPPPPPPWRPATFDEAMKLHGTLLRRIAFERKAPARGREINRTLISNYTQIDDALLNLIQNAALDNPAIVAARTFSRTLNEMFTRGPMGQVLGFAGRRERVVAPDLAIQRLLTEYEGTQQVSRIGQTIPVAGPRTQAAAEEAVRAQFRETVQDATPAQINRYMAQISPAIQPLSRVYNELNWAAHDLVAAHEQLAAVRAHALSRFTATVDGRPVDVQTAVRSLFSSATGPTDARAIMRGLAGHPDAEAALKAGLIDHIFRSAEARPSTLQAILDTPKTRRLFEAVFSQPEIARLRRLVDYGLRVENGDEKFFSRIGRSGLPIIARIFGAQVGRTVARFTGGGTVQTPGIIAGVTKNWAMDALKGIPVSELMARAVLDPRWERVLLSRVPETPKQVRAFIPVLKRLIRYSNAAIASWNDARSDEQKRYEEVGNE